MTTSARDQREDVARSASARDASRRRDVLVPALRALARRERRESDDAGEARATETRTKETSASLLDASDRALAETMLRDEDWRVVAAAEAAARVAREKEEKAAAARERAVSRKKSYAPTVSVPSASAAMSRMMIGAKRPSAALVISGGDDPTSPVAPSVDFATLVGEAAPAIDAAPAPAEEASGETRRANAAAIETTDAPFDEGDATSGAAAAAAATTTAAPASATISGDDAADGRRPEAATVPSKEKDEDKDKERRPASSSVSSKMFAAMPSAPKIRMPSVKNPFGK